MYLHTCYVRVHVPVCSTVYETMYEFLSFWGGIQIVDGYMQVRFNLGSGEAMTQQRTVIVNDGELHTVQFFRTEQTGELLLDGSFFAKVVSPGGESTLDVAANSLFVGGGGEKLQSFTGCIWGVKLDGRDLPTAQDTNDFDVMVSPGGVSSPCPEVLLFIGPMESPRPSIFVYSTIAAMFVTLVFFSLSFVILCKVCHHHYTKRKTGGAGRFHEVSSPNFRWHRGDRFVDNVHLANVLATGKSTTKHRQHEVEELALHSYPPPHFHAPPPPTSPAPNGSPYPSVVPTFSASEHSTGHLSHSRSRDSSLFAGSVPGADEKSQSSYQDQSTTALLPPTAHHTRSSSGHHSQGTEKSDIASLFQDDQEVNKYLRKRVEEADFELEESTFDSVKPYKDEGPYDPMGSLGSLHDIVNEAELEISMMEWSTMLEGGNTSDTTSVVEHVYLGEYGKKLDKLLEEFTDMANGFAMEQDTSGSETQSPKHQTVKPQSTYSIDI